MQIDHGVDHRCRIDQPLQVFATLGILDPRRQRAVGVAVGQVDGDGGVLAHDHVAVGQSRDLPGGIELQVIGRLLLALADVDGPDVEGDAQLLEHPVGDERPAGRRVIEGDPALGGHGALRLRP
jgi:hypothetical protein